MSTNTVTLKILDKEYQVACPPEEQTALMQAGQFLDQKMRGIRTSGKVIGLERIAVMAALNISYELLNSPNPSSEEASEVEQRIQLIQTKIDDALKESEQIGLTDNP